MRASYILGGVLGISLLAFSGCTSCRRLDTGVHIDLTLAAYVPRDATGIGSIDLDRLKQSALYRKFAHRLNFSTLSGGTDPLKEFGLDPGRDLSSALLFLRQNDLVVFAHGRFSGGELQSKLVNLGAKKTDYKGHVFLANGSNSLFFPQPDVAAAGSTSALKSVVDAGKPRQLPEAIAARLRLLSHDDEISASIAGPFPVSKLPIRGNYGSLVSSLAGFVSVATIGIHADSGLHAEARLECISEKGAEQVREAFRGVIGFARLSTDTDQKDLLRLYDSIQVDQDKTLVRVRADLPAAVSELLLERAADKNR